MTLLQTFQVMLKYGDYVNVFDKVDVMAEVSSTAPILDMDNQSLKFSEILIIGCVALAAVAIIACTCICLFLRTKKTSLGSSKGEEYKIFSNLYAVNFDSKTCYAMLHFKS